MHLGEFTWSNSTLKFNLNFTCISVSHTNFSLNTLDGSIKNIKRELDSCQICD